MTRFEINLTPPPTVIWIHRPLTPLKRPKCLDSQQTVEEIAVEIDGDVHFHFLALLPNIDRASVTVGFSHSVCSAQSQPGSRRLFQQIWFCPTSSKKKGQVGFKEKEKWEINSAWAESSPAAERETVAACWSISFTAKCVRPSTN